MTRLELLGDAVIALEAVRDDSGVARMISDGSRSVCHRPAPLQPLHDPKPPCLLNMLFKG